MAETVTRLLEQYLSPHVVVFLISLLPILELRGALIAASLLGIPWKTATVISIIGNMLPVPVILLFVRPVLRWMKKIRPLSRLAIFFEEKAMAKGAQVMEKYPRQVQLGLFLFVAIPLPGTGAWTGSLIAAFLGLPFRRSVAPICLGVFGAACVMLSLTYLLPWLAGFR